MRRTAVLLAFAAVSALALSACGQAEAARLSVPANDGWKGTVLAQPWSKPSFTLTDTSGQAYDFKGRTEGYLTLLFFGYTHCPDVCPLDMANIAAVMNEVPGAVRANTRVVFATTDPARDTPARLKSWLANFDPTFVGLTGTATQMTAAQVATGIPVSVAEKPKPDGSYIVGHAAQVIAYTRDDVAHVVYPFGIRQSDYADDLPRLLANPAWNPPG